MADLGAHLWDWSSAPAWILCNRNRLRSSLGHMAAWVVGLLWGLASSSLVRVTSRGGSYLLWPSCRRPTALATLHSLLPLPGHRQVTDYRWFEDTWYGEGEIGNREPLEVTIHEDEETAGESMDSMDLIMYGMNIKKSDLLPLDRPVADFRSEVREQGALTSGLIEGLPVLALPSRPPKCFCGYCLPQRGSEHPAEVGPLHHCSGLW